MTSKERAEEFVRRVLLKDLKQDVSDRTVREVAKQVLAVTSPVEARAQRPKKDPRRGGKSAA